MLTARRNSDAPSAGRSPLPDPDSEFRNWVIMTHSGSQTRHSTFPFDTYPCDRRLGQRVECITFETRATGCENDDDRLVGHMTKLSRDG